MAKNKKNKRPKSNPRHAAEVVKERNERRLSRGKTQNGRHIIQTMIDEKIRGDFRNYVIIVGDQLLDWRRTMTLSSKDGKPVRVDKPVLVHKSKLKNIISQEAAERFWHPRYGRLVDIPPATKTKESEIADGTKQMDRASE